MTLILLSICFSTYNPHLHLARLHVQVLSTSTSSREYCRGGLLSPCALVWEEDTTVYTRTGRCQYHGTRYIELRQFLAVALNGETWRLAVLCVCCRRCRTLSLYHCVYVEYDVGTKFMHNRQEHQ